MRRFFIEKTNNGRSEARVRESDARHILNVLRLGLGDALEVTDGGGNVFPARIARVEAGGVFVSLEAPIAPRSESFLEITLAQAMLKDKKMDVLVRQATELGMHCWLPFYAARSVPRPDPRRFRGRVERWEKIAAEALKQCERERLPVIEAPVSMEEMLEKSMSCDLKIVFWEKESVPLEAIPADPENPVRSALVIVGPEGGFTPGEIARTRALGARPTAMGPRVLRAETAAVTAMALVQFVFGDLRSGTGRAECG